MAIALLIPFFVSTALVTLLCLLLFIAIWEQRNLPGAAPLAFLILSVNWWVFSSMMEDIAATNALEILWAKLQYFAIEIAPVLWLLFSLAYSRLIYRLPAWVRRNLGWIWAFPALTILAVLVNEQHGLIWSQIIQVGEILRYDHGVWFWIAAGYNYILMTSGALILFWMISRAPHANIMQTAILILGASLPFISNILYLFRLQPPSMGDLTPSALMFTCVLYAWGIFRYQLFDLVPVARETLVDRLADGMLVMDNQERLLYINPAIQQLLKMPEKAQKSGFSLTSKFPSINAELAFTSHLDILQRIRNNQTGEIEIFDRRGQPRYFNLNIDQLTARDGQFAGKMVLLQDITSIKLSEERFRSIVNIVPDAILLVNEFGEIVLANAQCTSILGYKPDELIGKPVEEFIPERIQDHIAARQAYSQNPQPRMIGANIEIYARHKDGREFPADVNLSPMNTPNGALVLVAIRDISQRKNAEEQLHLQISALEAAATGIVITEIDGDIIWVNPAFTQITGFSADDVIGRNPRILNSGSHGEDFFDAMWKTVVAGDVWQGETINRRKDGSLYVEDQTIAPVRDQQGRVTHFIATKQDVSKRKQLEELRDQLMQTIVHDLRSPLTSLLAALDLLDYWSDRLELESEPREILQISRTSSWRMLGMVNTILDLSKLEAGKMQLNREPVVLTSLLEQIFRIESPLAIRREVLLLNNVPFDLPIVQADQMLIGRVLQNLVDNALKYSPEGCNVEVNARFDAKQQMIEVSIHDEGAGISPEAKSRLFEKFSSGSKERGTGLGLAFCRIVIEAHGGKIWTESESGKGTTFVFLLPLDEKSSVGSEI